MTTTVINIRKMAHEAVLALDYVYIGRGSKWGNPYTHLNLSSTGASYQVKSHEEAIECYKVWFKTRPELQTAIEAGELRGKVLGCFCHPAACHGHYLAKLSNDLFADNPNSL